MVLFSLYVRTEKLLRTAKIFPLQSVSECGNLFQICFFLKKAEIML
jgi:hypothetical protein